jgi:hypothetical protein
MSIDGERSNAPGILYVEAAEIIRLDRRPGGADEPAARATTWLRDGKRSGLPSLPNLGSAHSVDIPARAASPTMDDMED